MATVVNKARPAETLDPSYCGPNRTSAGEPNGTLTPQFAGEIVLDTTNNCLWKAISLSISSWAALTPPN
jgi:hypothetical protein